MTLMSELDLDAVYPATPTVPDSVLHSVARHLAYGALRGHFAERRDCFVGEDNNVYYRFGDPAYVVAPDVYVCFGVDPEPLAAVASYRVFEAGAPPAFVLEIASKKTVKVDTEVKPDKYLDMGVAEYWRFDPAGGEFLCPPLQAERRVGDAWEPIEVTLNHTGRLHGHSTALGLDLHADAHRLRFHDPATGQWLLDPDERIEAQHASETRATREAAHRAAAETRAAAAETRAAAAEAELAALRARLNKPPE